MLKATALAERAAELLPVERALSKRGRLAIGSSPVASPAAWGSSASAACTWCRSAAGGSSS
eukprot:6363763-Pyramimonas_sp.AAC.1